MVATYLHRDSAPHNQTPFMKTYLHEAIMERLADDILRLRDQIDLALEVIEDMVAQNCTMRDSTLDSCAITAHADAMRFLADLGKLTITAEEGRRVIGHWPKPSKEQHNGND